MEKSEISSSANFPLNTTLICAPFKINALCHFSLCQQLCQNIILSTDGIQSVNYFRCEVEEALNFYYFENEEQIISADCFMAQPY